MVVTWHRTIIIEEEIGVIGINGVAVQRGNTLSLLGTLKQDVN